MCIRDSLPPTDDYNDPDLALAVEGGPTGTEFTMDLLKQAGKHLKSSGSIYMIISSRMEEFDTDWNQETIKQEKYFFERLNLVRFFAV